MWRRVRIYTFGLGLGCLMVYFFLIRGQSRDFGFWLPENRIWEEISSNPVVYSSESDCHRRCYDLSKREVKLNLSKANVDFERSLPREKPRKYYLEDDRFTYWIEIEKKLVRVRSIIATREKAKCECSL